eukprot:CAMPEP_0181436376 /NCGR_PEP_ID=MMETSP1110-20121109/20819_1 /TAXON_ID=174948 /ORGANISM="Symbiodinium sp., Strain CCMP421" /LENGTH=189 /DNA_ID=CAMNT_0023559945 /DNA_START=102 /DNA_END=672 /DNA_ORIENTATION=-
MTLHFEAGKTFALGATAVALRAMGPLPSTLTTLLVAAGGLQLWSLADALMTREEDVDDEPSCVEAPSATTQPRRPWSAVLAALSIVIVYIALGTSCDCVDYFIAHVVAKALLAFALGMLCQLLIQGFLPGLRPASKAVEEEEEEEEASDDASPYSAEFWDDLGPLTTTEETTDVTKDLIDVVFLRRGRN